MRADLGSGAVGGENKLDNLTAIIDRNNIQIDGFTEDIMPLEPLDEKFQAFGWHVIEINGNDIRAVYDAIFQARAIFENRSASSLTLSRAKGWILWSKTFNWHGKPPNKEEGEKALRQLRTLGGKITSENE